jgi:hypothetical protein
MSDIQCLYRHLTDRSNVLSARRGDTSLFGIAPVLVTLVHAAIGLEIFGIKFVSNKC